MGELVKGVGNSGKRKKRILKVVAIKADSDEASFGVSTKEVREQNASSARSAY